MRADPPKKRPIQQAASRFPRDAHALWELLDFAPVSLWIEDWSRVKQKLDEWRASGIADPVAHVAADPANLEILARAFRVIDVNATSVTVYGAPDKESLIADFERHAVDTICGPMRDFFIDAIRTFENGGTQIDIEAWDRQYDGQRIRVHVSIAIAPNDRKWKRAVLAIKDVTEAWHAREAVAASRDLLSQAARLARLAHWIRDGATARVIHCGEEISSITGRTADEWATLVGSTAIEACIERNDRDRYRQIVPAAIAAGTPYSIEYRLAQPGGAERWVRECGAPLVQASSSHQLFLCTLQDITDQRQAEAGRRDAEAQLQGFLENAPFAMFVKDRELRYIYANRQTVRTLARSIEEIIGRRLEEVFPPEAAEIYRNEDEEVVATGVPVIRESRVTGPAGVIWANVIRFPIFDEAGGVRAIGGMAIDITEIKRAEEALREQHEFFRLVIDSAGAYIMVFDGAGGLVACNKAYQTFCGVSFEELQRDDGWIKTVLQEDMPAVRGALAPDDPAKFPNFDLTRSVRADGDIRLVHWVNAAMTGPDGRIKNIICIGTDITEQDRAEKALRISVVRWRAFKDNAPFFIFYKDPEGRYLDINSRGALFWKRSYEDIVGRTTAEIQRPEDCANFIQQDQEVLATRLPVTREYHSPGDPLGEWVRDLKFPIFDQAGKIVAIGGIGMDVTDLKHAQQALEKSEANLRAVLEGIVEGIVIFDASGAMLSVSHAAEAMLDYRASELTGRHLELLFPRLAAASGRSDAEGAIETWIGTSRELEAVARNGRRLSVAFSVNELPPSGGVRQFVGTILDLTTHKKLEDRLRQAQKMETIGQFTGGIAHDFNNLLAVVIGNLDLLGSQVTDERARKFVERASGAAQRGADLTRRLLAFARRQRLEPAPIDLGALIEEITPMVERTTGPEIRIRPLIAEGLWNASADRVQLEAALLNLINNARDAMPDGGELVIRMANHPVEPETTDVASRLQPGRYVEIAVVDSGTGMTPEVVQRAFEPFFTTKGVGRGTGLGLSMVHGFVQQSGGDVRIASTAGAGTTICLYLPAAGPVETQIETPSPQPGNTPRRILVVDDEPEVVVLVKESLGGLGYLVESATSGAEALELLKQPPEYDLLLTDVRMRGGMSGPQLAEEARAAQPNLRVLYMSGYDDAQNPQGGVPKGAGLLHKPFRNGDVTLAVVRALGA